MCRRAYLHGLSHIDLDEEELEDPEFVEDFTRWGDNVGDSCWQFLVDIDPEQVLERRAMQRSALARYGKQPWSQWDAMFVEDIDEAFNGIVDLVRQENELARRGEDR